MVHGRLAAALAEARRSGSVETSTLEGDHAHASALQPTLGGEGADEPRVSLTWPAPRWSLTWPATNRLAVTWPVFTPLVSPTRNDPQ